MSTSVYGFEKDLFKGKVALVTGGGTGIGRGIALAFASLGADVAICSRKPDHIEPTAADIRKAGGKVVAQACDIKDYAQCEAMVNATVAQLGRLDFLVNNAGANFAAPAMAISANGWKTIIDVVLNGTFHMTRAAGSALFESKGAVVNMAATNAWDASPFMAHSGAAKAGVVSLTETLAVEWGPMGVRVNAVCPGPVDTKGAGDRLWVSEEAYRRICAHVPYEQRMATVNDCVGPTLFLCSPAARFITGATLNVDGGNRLRQFEGAGLGEG